MTRTPLVRRTELRRSGPLRPVSVKKSRRAVAYYAARAQVVERAAGRCEARIVGVCTGRGQHAHHIRRRSQQGTDDPSNLLWTCWACHTEIHRRPAWAAERGLLARTGPVSATNRGRMARGLLGLFRGTGLCDTPGCPNPAQWADPDGGPGGLCDRHVRSSP